MAALRLRSRGAIAAALVLGTAVFSGAAIQTPPPQRDALKFDAAKPAVLLVSVGAGNAADFEKFWTEFQAALNTSDLAEVKAFAATFGPLAKIDALPGSPGAPVQYLIQLPSPSTTQSYNPGRVLSEFLFRQTRAVSRAHADSMMAMFTRLVESKIDIAAFQITR